MARFLAKVKLGLLMVLCEKEEQIHPEGDMIVQNLVAIQEGQSKPLVSGMVEVQVKSGDV